MAKVLVVKESEDEVPALKELERDGHSVAFVERPVSARVLRSHRDADVLSVFVSTKVGSREMTSLPRLKLIATRSTGYDHIDLRAADQLGIAVTNVPGYGSIPVAEHAIALALAVLRRVAEADRLVREGRWPSIELRGTLIRGKVFGVIGTGAIGLEVCRLAKAMGASVLASDIVRREDEAKEIGFEYVGVDELLSRSDIVSLHLPYSETTRHMIDRRAIERMKPGVVIVNTARGGLVDQVALVEALRSGKVGGAGLDVLESEPPEAGDEILSVRNAVITPHIAWNTDYSREVILSTSVENIRSFLSGRPTNVVNAPRERGFPLSSPRRSARARVKAQPRNPF
jgi:D-lactate dehydrogenase